MDGVEVLASGFEMDEEWALNVLKKPVFAINWLYQCHIEHHVVPQESYRVLPFSGLTMCVIGISADAQKEIQKHITQNGGRYYAELTRKCTHLIAEGSSMSLVKIAISQQNLYRVIRSSESLPSSMVGDEDFHSISATDHADPDLETTLSQNVSSMFVDLHFLAKEDNSDVAAVQSNGEVNHDGWVAEDSENEDNDLYLSECRLTSSNARFPQECS